MPTKYTKTIQVYSLFIFGSCLKKKESLALSNIFFSLHSNRILVLCAFVSILLLFFFVVDFKNAYKNRNCPIWTRERCHSFMIGWMYALNRCYEYLFFCTSLHNLLAALFCFFFFADVDVEWETWTLRIADKKHTVEKYTVRPYTLFLNEIHEMFIE